MEILAVLLESWNMGTYRTDDEGHRRSALTVLLLLAAIGLVGVLTGQAYYAARSHRETAELVHRDYSRLVADEFIQRVTREIGYYGYYPLITALKRAESQVGSGPLLSPSGLAAELDASSRPAHLLARTIFRANPTIDAIEVTGAGLDAGADRWLLAELRRLEPRAAECPRDVFLGASDGHASMRYPSSIPYYLQSVI